MDGAVPRSRQSWGKVLCSKVPLFTLVHNYVPTNRGVHDVRCFMGNQGKMAGNSIKGLYGNSKLTDSSVNDIFATFALEKPFLLVKDATLKIWIA